MELDKGNERLGKFIKAGILVLSYILLLGCGIIYIPKAVAVFQDEKKVPEMPINRVACKEKKLALSFDVGGGEKDLNQILSLLKKHDIKATFFVNGCWIAKHPDTIRTIYTEGHDIGNHSQSHKKMQQLSEEECEEQIKEVHNSIKTLTGETMNLFRAPYDEYGEAVMEASKSMGYFPIRWNIDSMDWKDYGVAPIVNEICNNQNLKNGSIILCHTGTKFTKNALPKVITTLQKRGYSFEKVSDLIYKYNYVIDQKGVQRKIKD